MADDNAIPVRISHYEILKTIGKGNFAVVKLARHTITHSKVAIKVISTRTLDSDQLRKLKREIDIMKRVGVHKNILRLYQVMQSDRHVMLVTEYCEGGEIFDQLVTNGRMTEKNARIYFHQIMDAVFYLHSNGIVHRDLKAENLLLTSDFKCVKLADFGFSNYFTSGNFLATWCGSPPYAAPELFEGKQYNGPKADIWSMGVVLYVLVCGALPFDGNTLQSLKTRVLSGKFRIPYFMSCDCEHLIRHMLVTDPDKRYTLQQIKQHKWMQQSEIESQHSSEKLSDELKNCHISTDKTNVDDDIDSTIVDWISSELNVESNVVIESVSSHLFDQYYALYHLAIDTSHCTSLSAPPSPPLLPIIPSINQRKSSITTGVVEREQTSTNLTPNFSNLRRHTFGPNTNAINSANSNSQNQLVTPPLLFLTPPIMATSNIPPIANLPFAPPNYPLANMDLLRPPPVLLMVNNNMGRRASDGQANYARTLLETSQGTLTSASTYNFPTKGSSHQTSPPITYFKRKRHSLTDTNEIVSRQRRSGLSNIGLSSSSERSRRRASDGSGVLTSNTYPQHISIPTLQSELRALCVSSPPSLHASPIHTSSMANSSHKTSMTNTSVTSLPPSSPPPALPLISEENSSSYSTFNKEQEQQQQQQAPPPPRTEFALLPNLQKTKMLSKTYSHSPVPLITPPHSFRSSPVTSPNAAPSIAITDELGTMQFPILPPPIDFQLASSHPNLENDPEKSTVAADILYNKLHRWTNDENFIIENGNTSYPNLSTTNHQSDILHHVIKDHKMEKSCIELVSSSFHYSSLQCVHCSNNAHLTTTDSGSICITDLNTATKLLNKFGHNKIYQQKQQQHILNIDESNLQISIEWNELQQQMILRHVSGDASRYKHLCRELISTII